VTDVDQVTRYRWKRIESLLCMSLVALKFGVLGRQWSNVTGYDWFSWLPIMHWTHWFENLPSTRSFASSYHPPLSFLIARLIYVVYPHEVEVSQVLSTAAMLGAFFVMRAWLKRLGWLFTMPGLWLLYGGMSIPLFVWLGVETSYDALVLTLFMMALAMSTALFWKPSNPRWWTNLGFSTRLTGLGIILACGMLTKVNTLISFSLPYLIIFVRRGLRGLRREFIAPLVAAAIAIVIIAPLYHHHFYKTEGTWIAICMEWERPHDLLIQRAKRDRAPAQFIAHMLHWPRIKNPDPQTADFESFPSLIWTETWIKDSWLGKQTEPSLSISVRYAQIFRWILAAGTGYFLLRFRRISKAWSDVGWILLVVTLLFSIAQLYFGWKYPLWDYRVFKAKYMSPGIFWIAYATGIFFSDRWFRNPKCRALKWLEEASFVALVAFMFANHLFPVY
jgi:hypothetical protein